MDYIRWGLIYSYVRRETDRKGTLAVRQIWISLEMHQNSEIKAFRSFVLL